MYVRKTNLNLGFVRTAKSFARELVLGAHGSCSTFVLAGRTILLPDFDVIEIFVFHFICNEIHK
jgi:hypothetical protein